MGSNGCCCSCNCNCNSSDYITIDELIKRFEKSYKDVGEFKIYKHTKQNSFKYLAMLNSILNKNGRRAMISPRTMNFALPKLLPLIVVDKKIISINNYPDEKQLYDAVISGKVIGKQASCC